MAYRYTQLVTKSHKRLKAFYRKLYIRNREVWKIIEVAKKYDIELPKEVIIKVYELDKYFRHERYKVNEMINVRFNPLYKGGYGSWIETPKERIQRQ